VREQIRTWLEIGLFINWLGLQLIRYYLCKRYREDFYPIWWDIVGIVLWPMVFAHGVVRGYNSWRKKR
jgi:hypothetical protein